MENWYIGELSPLELYDFGGGNVVAPVPDINGGANASYLTSHMFKVNNVDMSKSFLIDSNAEMPTRANPQGTLRD